MKAVETTLRSFDGTECVNGREIAPRGADDLLAAMDGARSVIPRGAGLSYCLAAAGDGVTSLSGRMLNTVEGFDATTGVIDVGPGLKTGGLLRFALRHGWFVPVLPGHPAISVGGCIGFNVHGKSQAHSGNFMRWVKRLHVVHPDHGERVFEPGDDSGLFELTGGGFGLTGFVVRARLQLVPLAGGSLVRDSIPVANLDESLACMENDSPGAHAVYSWNDLTRKKSSFGRGVVYVERFSDVPLPRSCRFRELTPQQARLPVSALNRLTTPSVNWLYGAVERVRAPRVRLPIEVGSFPINGKEFYYALFGRRGFREYQALVPRESWDDFSCEVRRLVRFHRMTPALGSMKLFAGERFGLNFAGEGVCLAIDVPASEGSLDFFSNLDTIVIEASGVVNISKDSRLSKNTVSAMFDGFGEFVTAIQLADPSGRMTSSLRRRLID